MKATLVRNTIHLSQQTNNKIFDKIKTMIYRYLIILLLACISLETQAQRPRFNKESRIDTLSMSISFSDRIAPELQKEFAKTFEQSITAFNSQATHAFHVARDSTRTGDFIHVEVGEIKYVTFGRSAWVTLLDLGLLAADVALVFAGWPPFLLPILLPAVRSHILLDMSPGVVHEKNKVDHLGPLPTGYFVGIEKQNERFNQKIGRNLNRLLRKLNKQQLKNNP